MSGLKQKDALGATVEAIEKEAEELFRSGKMNCAEAVLATLKNHFRPELPDDITDMATGFGGGSGSGCICGALTGATMAMGLIVKNDKTRLKDLTRELHKWFTASYGATCCRVVLSGQKGICASLTGKVAGKATSLLL
jgi:C_GCAxxG_C_C family probable redox protein